MFLVGIQKFCAPEFLITKQIVLCSVTAGQREPLHVISHPDVVVRWIIEAGMRGGGRNNGRQVRREFLRRCPLIEARIRTAPHGDLAIAKWLLRQPLNDVVSIARFICERLKLAAGISAAANIDQREPVTMRGEVSAARMVRVRRRQCKDYRRPRRRAIWSLW